MSSLSEAARTSTSESLSRSAAATAYAPSAVAVMTCFAKLGEAVASFSYLWRQRGQLLISTASGPKKIPKKAPRKTKAYHAMVSSRREAAKTSTSRSPSMSALVTEIAPAAVVVMTCVLKLGDEAPSFSYLYGNRSFSREARLVRHEINETDVVQRHLTTQFCCQSARPRCSPDLDLRRGRRSSPIAPHRPTSL